MPARTRRSPFRNRPVRSCSRRSSRAVRGRSCTWSRARTRPIARPVRSRATWASSMWCGSPSAPIAPGRTRRPTMPWSPAAAPRSDASRAATRASWSLRHARSCAAFPLPRAAFGLRRRFRWGARSPLTRCRDALWEWATPRPAPPTFRERSTCTATRSTSFPHRQSRRCAWSFSATRSTASAAWWHRPARPSATRSPSRSFPAASSRSPTTRCIACTWRSTARARTIPSWRRCSRWSMRASSRPSSSATCR